VPAGRPKRIGRAPQQALYIFPSLILYVNGSGGDIPPHAARMNRVHWRPAAIVRVPAERRCRPCIKC